MSLRPVVKRKRKTRSGKGFSQREIREAGLNTKDALKRGIPIDTRRRSKYEENVKAFLEYVKQNTKKDQ